MDLFQTPAIITGVESADEYQFEIDRMLRRSQATADFLDGKIDAATWEDVLNENGIDVIQAAEDWVAGIDYQSGTINKIT